ncbi:unnamed protein product [Gulo gulo]|uniref:Uncharacterized protein n=1 Tax=Gulo gulo TaxID=48420 RepID=A0A9X9LZK2_GULGU|nr:unnamed protein product [Gulo gulo]
MMVAFQRHIDSICVRLSNRMGYIHLLRGTLPTLLIQYCLNHVPPSFCHLSHTWSLCVLPLCCHRVVTQQLPTGFSYKPKKNIIRNGEPVAKSIA